MAGEAARLINQTENEIMKGLRPEKHAKIIADCRGDLRIFYAVATMLECGNIYCSENSKAVADIQKICKRQVQTLLKKSDKHMAEIINKTP